MHLPNFTMYISVFSLFPVVEDELSDTGKVDNILELLIMAGQRSLPEVCSTEASVQLPDLSPQGEG
jgi:hypothetical protein